MKPIIAQHTAARWLAVTAGAGCLLLTSCNGLFSWLYDDPPSWSEETHISGQLKLDASSWTSWKFVNLEVEADSLITITTLPIPTDEATGPDDKTGIYSYWYDVFGQGISKNEYRSFYSTAAQTQPEAWTFAVHRNNVMTNGGAVFETTCTSISELPESSDAFSGADFASDTWNEKDVWVIQDKMVLGIIGNQGISINATLSSWLTIDIPPMPPAYTLNDHVFILRTASGKYAALQLENYKGTDGTNCCLTVNYKYPY